MPDNLAEAPPSGEAAPPGSTRQWYLVGVLTTLYTLNFVDRGALNLIVNPIKDDLHISDVQTSLLIGLSFVLLYAILTIPAGYLADILSRRILICVAVLFWSCMAATCGFAGNFWQLFAGRMGLGVGEAAWPSAAYSMLRDGVSEKNRGRAFSVYQAGLTLGSGIGALAGGWLYGLGVAGWFHGVPILGNLKPWQIVIVVPAICGMGLSMMMLTVREPARPVRTDTGKGPSFDELYRYVLANWRVYVPIVGASATVSLAGGGWGPWMAAALGRIWGLSPAVIGKTVGTMGVLLFPVAALLLGLAMDYFRRRGRVDAAFRVAIVGILLHIGPALYIFQAQSVSTMWIAYGLSVFLTTSGVQISCGVMLATVTPGRMMGKMTSFYYLVSILLGQVPGVTGVAALAQYVFSGPRALADAMSICYVVFLAITVLLLILGCREIRRWYAINEGRPAG